MISFNDFIEVMYKNNNWFVLLLGVCLVYFIWLSYRFRTELIRSKPVRSVGLDPDDPYKQNIQL